MSKFFPINALIDKLTEYAKLKGDQIKLDVMGRVAKVLASVITFLILGMIGFMLLFFVSITLAELINVWLVSTYLGHLIVSGLLLVSVVIFILFLRTGKIQRWFENMILSMAEDE